VDLLFHLYREARRPTLRGISDQIRKNSELRGTASTETIRKMLRGTTVPPHWETVEAVIVAMNDMAERDLDSPWEWQGVEGTMREHFERLWHGALDEPDVYYRRSHDPWEEPPF
jgi:hypothetical protein